jgi:hypothetical protein
VGNKFIMIVESFKYFIAVFIVFDMLPEFKGSKSDGSRLLRHDWKAANVN